MRENSLLSPDCFVALLLATTACIAIVTLKRSNGLFAFNQKITSEHIFRLMPLIFRFEFIEWRGEKQQFSDQDPALTALHAVWRYVCSHKKIKVPRIISNVAVLK